MVRKDDSELDWKSYGLSFAERLKWLRHYRSLSQNELAELSGIHRNQISNLERNASRDGGSADPRMSTIYHLARALDVPPEVLLPDSDRLVQRRSGEHSSDRAITMVTLELDRRVRSLPAS